MIQSKETHNDRKFTHVQQLNPQLANKIVWLRGRLHTSRAKGIVVHESKSLNIILYFIILGKQCFIVIRQQSYTIQGLAAVNDTISKQMVKFISK